MTRMALRDEDPALVDLLLGGGVRPVVSQLGDGRMVNQTAGSRRAGKTFRKIIRDGRLIHDYEGQTPDVVVRRAAPKGMAGDAVVGHGDGFLRGVTDDGRISHLRDGRRLVLNDEQTMAELAQLPAWMRSQIMRLRQSSK